MATVRSATRNEGGRPPVYALSDPTMIAILCGTCGNEFEAREAIQERIFVHTKDTSGRVQSPHELIKWHHRAGRFLHGIGNRRHK